MPYAPGYKGQLGHVVHRNGTLKCTFETETDQQRFAAIWRRAIGKEPVFEPFPVGPTCVSMGASKTVSGRLLLGASYSRQSSLG